MSFELSVEKDEEDRLLSFFPSEGFKKVLHYLKNENFTHICRPALAPFETSHSDALFK